MLFQRYMKKVLLNKNSLWFDSLMKEEKGKEMPHLPWLQSVCLCGQAGKAASVPWGR